MSRKRALAPPDRSFAGTAGLCALFALVGLGSGLLLDRWEAFNFQPDIALGQIVQTCALLFIFLLANHFYAKAHDVRKKKVEILVDMVGEILKQAQQANSIFRECAQGGAVSRRLRLSLDQALRNYSNAVDELGQVLEHSGPSAAGPGFEELQRNRAEYKDLVTESPYPESLPVPAKRTKQESMLYSKLKSNLRKFQMDLASRV